MGSGRSVSISGTDPAFGINVTYAPQRHQNGTADAVRSVRDLVTGPFLLMNGDMILKSADIAEFCHCKTPCMGISTTDHPGIMVLSLLTAIGLHPLKRNQNNQNPT